MKLKALALAAMMGLGAGSLAAHADELRRTAYRDIRTGQRRRASRYCYAGYRSQRLFKGCRRSEKQADDRVAQYFDFLNKNGIEKKDIDAANLRTQPEYDYTKEGKSVLKGYRAVRQVQVTLRQLDKLNDLLDGALKSGLNEIRSVELGVANPDDYKAKARQAAIENATQQAAALAQGFNAKLGPVYSVRYHVANYQPMPIARMYKAADAAPMASAAQTYEQQSIHFDDQVDVVFELQRNP